LPLFLYEASGRQRETGTSGQARRESWLVSPLNELRDDLRLTTFYAEWRRIAGHSTKKKIILSQCLMCGGDGGFLRSQPNELKSFSYPSAA
jgi:hypothetical protein